MLPRRFGRHGQWLAGGRGLADLAASVEPLLFGLPGRRPVIRGAPLAGTLPAMMLPTAERTPQLLPTHIAGMREKTNPALRAGSYAPAQLGMRLQDRVQRGLILPDKRPGAVLLVPIGAKREKLLDGYGKKARSSAILSIVVDTPSSYLFDANASRGRARFFMRPGQGSAATVRINGPSPTAHPGRSACRVSVAPLRGRS